MNDLLTFHYDVDGDNFSIAGESSSSVKKELRQLGISPEIIRKVAVSMYEAEINMVIHASGGTIDVSVSPETITVVCKDNGPGIPDIEKAKTAGFSTATEKIRELGFGAGMGLPNIINYTDKMEIETQIGKGTTVTMVINNCP